MPTNNFTRVPNPKFSKKLKTAMILAAGYGSRMGGLTKQLPKPLLPLNGDRVIEIIIKKLASQGIERIVINTHQYPDKFRKFLGDGRKYQVEIIYSDEQELLGSGGGIANAEKFFAGETIMAVNGDVLCNIEISDLYKYHCRHQALATMTIIPSQNNRDYGLVLLDNKSNLKGFLGKNQPVPTNLKSGIFTGHQILTPQARAYLNPRHQSIITRFYLAALANRENIKIFPFEGNWIDLGTAEFYHKLVQKIQSGMVAIEDL